MIRSDYLIGIFASILGGLALPACGIDCGGDAGDPPMTELRPTSVDPEQLSEALADGVLDPQECAALCEGDPVSSSATATGSSSTTGSTSDGSTSGGSTSGGSTSGGSTSDGSTSGGSTSDGSTSGGSTSGGSTGEGSKGEGSTSGGSTTDATTGSEAMAGTCEAIEGETAQVSCVYEVYYVCGRRPSGLCSEGQGKGPTLLSRFFAESAHLEAASVTAFERLAAELRAMQAPDELIVAAERAAADEVRHAQSVGELAELCGGQVSSVDFDLDKDTLRSRLEIAIENATEGCVGETWGALLAAHQAAAAEDPELRRCMAIIAADEARHAALAWAVDEFFKDRLTAAERSQVEAARRQAALALRTSQSSPPELAALVGLPAAGPREQLWAALDREFWHAAA